MRGYYISNINYVNDWMGSLPPLTRVLHNHSFAIKDIFRITPACAGTTLIFLQVLKIQEDHPRLRGYYETNLDILREIQGSPPLTRVLLSLLSLGCPQPRITPAHAGTTIPLWCGSLDVQDHPRSRGYYQEYGHEKFMALGSPPLTRVLLYGSAQRVLMQRITPAHAGTTLGL